MSADVLNDILDRIELTLVSITSSELLGEWDMEQVICISNSSCWRANINDTGFTDAADGLTTSRLDTVTFSDDGDGTFSYSQSTYCAFITALGSWVGTGGSSCSGSYAIKNNSFIFNGQPTGIQAYDMERVSKDRFILTFTAPGSSILNIIKLDKKALPPAAPTSLAATVSSGSIALTWTAGDATEDSYDVQRKSSATGTYTSIGLPTTESYTDTTGVATTTYWYRVFAKNTNGTSIGSNVISVVAQ